MTIRTKLTALVALNTVVVMGLLVSALSFLIRVSAVEETGGRALAVARHVAAMPVIVGAMRVEDPAQRIQPVTEELRKVTGAEFIVVGNMDLIRHSHPHASEIGKRMVGDDDDLVLHGHESITTATGTLGPSVRGKVPIFDDNHQQIGVVSTGFLVKGINRRVHRMIRNVVLACGVMLLLGMLGAWILSGHFKKQILGMEPAEIAFTTRQQAAILDAIHEGVLAVNSEGRVVTANREAKKILSLDGEDVIGKPVTSLLPATRLPEVLRTGVPHYDQPLIVGDSLLYANRVPVRLEGQVIGAVATFRDKLPLDAIETRLADIGQYVDDLRSQRHEFMNQLHVISGLIHATEFETAQALIERVSDDQQRALGSYMGRIRDPAVLAILIGKTHQARELGIELVVSPDSSVPRPCPHRDAIVTIAGNAITNALEALQSMKELQGKPEVQVSLRDEPSCVIVEVRDNGPGIEPARASELFTAGVSTKGTGRGVGLAIVARLVSTVRGEVSLQRIDPGTMFRAVLPKELAS